MQKIDIESLSHMDMLDLIEEHKIDIVHVTEGNYIAAMNWLEGSAIHGRSTNGVIEAIKMWAHHYNRMIEATRTLDEERND